MGRKPTGKTPITAARLRLDQRQQVEEYAKRKGTSFSDALRELLDIGLLNAESDDDGGHE